MGNRGHSSPMAGQLRFGVGRRKRLPHPRLRFGFQRQHLLGVVIFGHAADKLGAKLEAFVERPQVELPHHRDVRLGDVGMV